MKSKKRREQIKAKRAEKRKQVEAEVRKNKLDSIPLSERVNADALAPYQSYGAPLFVKRGYYVDESYTCEECGKEELWSATQQKWWFEVAKGYIHSRATRCTACRRKKREHRERSIKGMQEKLKAKKG